MDRITIGFPRMYKEAGERRVFLPEFIQSITRFADIFLEEGYGSRSGFRFNDYRQGNHHIFQCERKETFQKDYIFVLRSPNDDEFSFIRPGSCLVSMLHYPTRPQRVQILNQLGIKAISLDSIVDDNNLRLVENMQAVAWNGIEAAFDILEKTWPGLVRPSNLPFLSVIIGTGMVGKHAMDAATKLGNLERNVAHIQQGGPGSVALCLGRNLSGHPEILKDFFSRTDILIDATQRRDPSQVLVLNEWLDWLPKHAIIVDLSVDPYLLDNHPPTLRAVEGLPQGNLDKYIFESDDPDWDKSVPSSIPSKHRRTTVTCYSWPGIHPEACMAHYARQLEPLTETLLSVGYDHISCSGGYFERALSRAKLPTWK